MKYTKGLPAWKKRIIQQNKSFIIFFVVIFVIAMVAAYGLTATREEAWILQSIILASLLIIAVIFVLVSSLFQRRK